MSIVDHDKHSAQNVPDMPGKVLPNKADKPLNLHSLAREMQGSVLVHTVCTNIHKTYICMSGCAGASILSRYPCPVWLLAFDGADSSPAVSCTGQFCRLPCM